MGDHFVSPCVLPTPAEAEILTTLIEEAAEVIQRATKLLRFGRDEVQPGQQLSNCYRLSEEVGDFNAMVKIAEAAGLLNWHGIKDGEARKPVRFAKYRQHRPSQSLPTDGEAG